MSRLLFEARAAVLALEAQERVLDKEIELAKLKAAQPAPVQEPVQPTLAQISAAAKAAKRYMDAGGPAYPNHPDMPIEALGVGMSLRDYFAAKAMEGFCGNSANKDALPKEIARGAYLVADAMLKARGA